MSSARAGSKEKRPQIHLQAWKKEEGEQREGKAEGKGR